MSEIKKHDFFKRPTKQISEVEKLTDKETNYLLFSYKDGEKEAFKIYTSSNLNEVDFLKSESGARNNSFYPIIDNQDYIDKKIENADYDFSNHIFLIDAYFKYQTFFKNTDFRLANFYGKALFDGAIFNEGVRFDEANFNEGVCFNRANFNEGVCFNRANFRETTFNKAASFLLANFNEKTYFNGANFNEKTYFNGANFNEKTYFNGANFNEKTYFTGANFIKTVNFTEAAFNKKVNLHKNTTNKRRENKENYLIDFTNSTFKENLKITLKEFKTIEKEESNGEIKETQEKIEHFLDLDLTNIYIQNGNFQFNDLLIETVLKSNNSPRETYRILKDILISHHDNINALEMHKKEYKTYYNKIKKDWKKNFGTFLILDFEKGISNFGTSIGRAIFYWFIIWLIFAILIIITYDHISLYKFFENISDINDKKAISYAFQPISFFSDNSFLLEKENISWRTIEILSFLKTIFLATITYEIIKSFRKFSRKF